VPDLIGSIATFDGDENQQYLVNPDTISAQAVDNDTWVPGFLSGAVGTGCAGYYATARQILDDAQAVAQQLQNSDADVPQCMWLRYFGPLVLNGQYTIRPPYEEEFIGNWRLSGKTTKITGAEVFPTGEIQCYRVAGDPKEWLYKGPRPFLSEPFKNVNYCNNPDLVTFMSSVLASISEPSGGFEFFKGTTSIVLLSDATDYNDPTLTYTPGGPFMPIPPIPDGYPAPLSAPPLRGQAIVDALSDDEAKQICIKGGAFLTWWDIGNRAPNQEEGERQWMQTYTQVLGDLNTEEMQNIVTNAPEVVLTNTSQIVLGKILDRIVDAGNVVVKSGGANKILTILGPAGKIIQTVEIASEIFQEVQMLLQQLYVPQCINSNPPDVVGTLRMIPIPFPVQTLDGNSTLNGMQAICDALYALLRCCPPCVQDIWHEGPTWDANVDWTPDFIPSAVLFQKIAVKYQENAQMGGQDKLGYFKWIVQDDENPTSTELQEPIWVNSEQSFFIAKNGMIRGLRWVPQNGVTVKVLYKFTDRDMGLNRLTAPQIP